MAERNIALEKGGPASLVLRWQPVWRDIEVRYQGELLGDIPNLDELVKGRIYTLPDRRLLGIRFQQEPFGYTGLVVTIDGRPVEGVSHDPRKTIRNAAIVLIVIGALNVALGIAFTVASGRIAIGRGMELIGDPAFMFGFASVLLGLAFATWRFHSRVAIVAAIVVEVVDALMVLFNTVEAGETPGLAMGLRVFAIFLLVRAYTAVNEAKRRATAEIAGVFE